MPQSEILRLINSNKIVTNILKKKKKKDNQMIEINIKY